MKKRQDSLGLEKLRTKYLESVPLSRLKLQSILGLLSDEPCTCAGGMLMVPHLTLGMGQLGGLIGGGSGARNYHGTNWVQVS